MKRKAFTIVELLIYLGLFSTILLVTTEIFVSITDVYLETEATSGLEQNANFLTKKIQNDIFRSTRIIEPENPATPGNRLILQIDGSEYVYEIQNEKLMLTAEDETNQLTNADVSVTNLTVKRIGFGTASDSARVEYSLRSNYVESSGKIREKDYFLVATPR